MEGVLRLSAFPSTLDDLLRIIFIVYNYTKTECNEPVLYFRSIYDISPVPVAARSKAWVCGRSLAETVGSNTAEGMDIFCECSVLSGRGSFYELISSPEESY